MVRFSAGKLVPFWEDVMSFIQIPDHAWKLGVDWKVVWLLAGVHAVGVVGAWYASVFAPTYTILLAIAVFFLCHLAIRTGAHSLYTHRAYSASFLWHALTIVFFAATMQGPLLTWVMLHVRHHQYPDTEKDPYSPMHGWLWAHMLWGCFKNPQLSARDAPWLLRGKTPAEKRIIALVKWQSERAIPAGFALGVLVPGLVASLWGDFWGGIMIAGFLRLVCQYHCTWQINSLSHIVGPRPFGGKNSSRDSPWWLFGIPSLLSVGEASGHNRHHRYSRDFRIGVGYTSVDPGKWLLYAAWGFSQILRRLGAPPLVWGLYRFDDDGSPSVLQ